MNIKTYSKRRRIKNWKAYRSRVYEVFGKHHKDCDHTETIVIEDFKYSTNNLCMGCGSNLIVSDEGIELRYGKSYPTQYTKQLYRKLLELNINNEIDQPCI